MTKHTSGPWQVRWNWDVVGYPVFYIAGMSGDEKRDDCGVRLFPQSRPRSHRRSAGGRMTIDLTCGICTKRFGYSWTDTHGIGQCHTCGAPYRVIHYQDGKPVERKPELLLDEQQSSECRRFWLETNARVSAVAMGLSFPGGQDVATDADIEAANEWFPTQPERTEGSS